MAREIISGVYEIRNTVNNKVYIGSSKDIYGRWQEHIYSLQKGNHHSGHLQNAWNKYGQDCFEFNIIEKCDPEDRYNVEQKYIDKIKSYDEKFGYNIKKQARINVDPALIEKSISDKFKSKYGEDCNSSKYTNDQINEVINLLLNPDYTYEDISKMTGVNRNVVSNVANGQNWLFLTKDIIIPKRSNGHRINVVLTANDVKEIIPRLLNGEKDEDIAVDYNVNCATIYNIRMHNTWKDYTENIVFPEFHHNMHKGANYYKLNENDIIDIINLYNDGSSVSNIEKKYHISPKIIYEVLHGERWPELSHLVTRKIDNNIEGISNPMSKLSEDDVLDIIQMRKNGCSRKDIHSKYNFVCKTTIDNIIYGVTWKNIPRN